MKPTEYGGEGGEGAGTKKCWAKKIETDDVKKRNTDSRNENRTRGCCVKDSDVNHYTIRD